jgi:hypothetical protein
VYGDGGCYGCDGRERAGTAEAVSRWYAHSIIGARRAGWWDC